MSLKTAAIAPATYVDTAAALDAAAERLSAAARIACDTESNSMHAYRGRTCLIQFSTPRRRPAH